MRHSSFSIQNMPGQVIRSVMSHIAIENSFLSFLNRSLIPTSRSATHPPLKRVVPRNFDLSLRPPLGFPLINMRAPIFPWIRIERAYLILRESLFQQGFYLRNWRLPRIPSFLIVRGFPNTKFEHMSIIDTTADQRGSIRFTFRPTPRPVKAHNNRVTRFQRGNRVFLD